MAVDRKYGDVEIPGIPDDEPVFIMRARDPFSVPVIARYRNFATSIENPDNKRTQEFIDGIDAVDEDFRTWQAANGTRLPD